MNLKDHAKAAELLMKIEFINREIRIWDKHLRNKMNLEYKESEEPNDYRCESCGRDRSEPTGFHTGISDETYNQILKLVFGDLVKQKSILQEEFDLL